MRQCNSLKFINDVPAFNVIRFQEISTCGNIIKKILYRDTGSFGGHAGFLRVNL